ncbi:muts domain V-domain-containing protein [Hygrophoropsis aurantiaca]|uniref:Muts domain V-domain-containing protein n=1 Tax=Hygrophoropsis aurantiaca TaxID=72124 RepID=A0ACB8AQR6_9AGAM|nr:muts domain V-domain-containing protein [Hygrophoropsis aurantiaca]
MHGSSYRHVVNAVRNHHFQGIQTFHSASYALASKVDTVLGKSSENSVIVTKKKYSELPKKRAIKAGVACLEKDARSCAPSELHLASEESQVTNRRRRNNQPPPTPELIDTSQPVVEKQKRRRRSATSEPLGTSLAKDNSPDKKTRRSRKTPPTTAQVGVDDGILEPVDAVNVLQKQPRNVLATEILANLARFPHCILLTRVGQFYESYFDQAKEVARLLNIKLTSRVWDKQNIAMCGFPLMHLDKHLKVLVQQNKQFVAMCEEFPRRYVSGQKPEFDRRVVRVITPGTLIDEPFLNHFENNFLLSISSTYIPDKEYDPQFVGLAWIDVSTGEFFAKTTSQEALRDDLARINPQEIVLDKSLETQTTHPIRQLLNGEDSFVSYVTPMTSPTKTSPDIFSFTDEINPPQGSSFAPAATVYTPQEGSAIDILVSYMRTNLLEHMPSISMPNREDTNSRMQIDSHTIKALEIRESAREGGSKGSLLSVVKKTVTSSGTRLLARWLCSPSTSVKEIQARQSLVAFFHSRQYLRDDLVQYLKEVEDASRIVQKFLLGRGDPGDMLAINKTILLWTSIRERIELERKMESIERGAIRNDDWISADTLLSRLVDLQALSHRISMAVQTTGTSNVPAGSGKLDDSSVLHHAEPETFQPEYRSNTKWSIKPEFSDHLTSLHSMMNDLLHRKDKLENELQSSFSAPSLTLRSSPGHGMHVHIARAKRDQLKVKESPHFIAIAENHSTSSFFYQPWSQLGSQLVETTIAIANAERVAFGVLRDEVKGFSAQLRRNAHIMDELDITIGFANLAAEMQFVRPLIKDGDTYEVTNGRHPTVELGLLSSGRVFTPNSIEMKTSSRLHVITGPNMAGKSTYLRQTALIAILAQTGSFVPADHANIGIVDKIFSRIGAKDDLFRDRSTFMVEMLETAEILRRATPKSLVIMDEVGRGTTVKDGLAIAFATIHHLVTVNQCRALFATHFHELADMLGYSNADQHAVKFDSVDFFCTDVDETEDGCFAYSHRLKPGVNRDSHGLKVAHMAGMPETALQLAKRTLSALGNEGIATKPHLALLGRSLIK